MTRDVLVVEDDGLVRGYLERVLELAGYRAVAVRGGGEALERLRSCPDLAAALIDGLLPDMHGTVLAARLLDEPGGARVPLCFVSGALRGPVPTAAGIAVLSKPVGRPALVAALDELAAWWAAGGSPPEERRAALAAVERDFLLPPSRPH